MAHSRTRRDRSAHHGVASTSAEIIREYVRLIAAEYRLFQTEVGEKIRQIGVGMALTVAATVLLIMAIVLLVVVAISALVDYGFGLTAATLTVFQPRSCHRTRLRMARTSPAAATQSGSQKNYRTGSERF